MTTGSASRDAMGATLAENRIVPVLTIERAADAVALARALVAGGLKALEITLRTAAALEAVRLVSRHVDGAIVGVGTVLGPRDLERAHEAGARFAFSPGATPALLAAAAACPLPFAPGVATASELMAALEHGFDIVKLFPAARLGGVAMARALGGPFPQARLCPTGGVRENDAAEWLAEKNVLAVGGSWLAPSADIRAGRWEAIEERARRSRALVVSSAR